MSSTTATTTASSAAGKKKPASAAAPSSHPKYSDMVQQALVALKERGGSSRQAVLKYIMANFKVSGEENMINAHLKMALKAGVKNGTLKQSKGTGATGSFRIGEKAKPAKSKTAVAAKPKKSAGAAKKSPATKKPASSSGDKAKTATTTKKVAKKSPAAAKKPAVAKPKSAGSDKKKVTKKPTPKPV